jgi:RNA polymerase sigma-70 factor (ECF subfamily)
MLARVVGIAQRVMGHQARGDRRRVRLGLRVRAASPLYETEEYERVAEALDAQRRLAGLAQALEKLPRRERAVLDLVALADLTPTQAAQALDISPNAARVRLSRARQRLRESEAALDPEATCARPASATREGAPRTPGPSATRCRAASTGATRSTVLSGFAWTGRGSRRIEAGFERCENPDGEVPCPVIVGDEPDWQRVEARRVR